MSARLGISLLGATGSIGTSTLSVIAANRSRFKVVALTANTAVDKLYDLCLEWNPRLAVMADGNAAEQLEQKLRSSGSDTQVLSGTEGLIEAAAHESADMVMAAIVGAAGLLPTLAAAKSSKRVLLANKESLVMSGDLFMQTIDKYQATLIPIDSEHNALFQCLHQQDRQALKGLVLTASGGPFRETDPKDLLNVTPAQACAHPNWDMGAKISVDSATLMNKGLEVIEAHHLFAVAPDKIDVVIHPESIIHSLVSYQDGSLLAQLGNPDMRVPIANALLWPERLDSQVPTLDLTGVAKLRFEAVNQQRFPGLQLAYEAMLAGGTTTAILNAANEVAVAAFLASELKFTDIVTVIEQTLAHCSSRSADSLEIVLADDKRARDIAAEQVQRLH